MKVLWRQRCGAFMGGNWLSIKLRSYRDIVDNTYLYFDYLALNR